MNREVKPVSGGAWFRIAFLALALINQGLVLAGHSPLPISDQDIEILFTMIWTLVASIIAWWKDNDWTEKARARKS